MIVAIMQPYFFPYIGYFQLMHAADMFVFHDDVQYIKGGWINRNRILVNNRADWLTMPVKSESSFLPIKQRYFVNEPGIINKMKRRVAAAYAKSSAFDNVAPTIFDSLDFPDANVAAFNRNSLIAMAGKLGVKCKFVTSSELDVPAASKGQDKVIELCRQLEANLYINPIGGVDLYDPVAFANAGITLSFLQTMASPAPTESGPQHLSVIDGVMRLGFEGYGNLLSEYTLLGKEDART